MKVKKIIAVLSALVILFSLAACSGGTESPSTSAGADTSSVGETKEISIAYQYGISYAPLLIMMEEKLIEECYNGDVTVNWTQLNSGAAINEAFAAGEVDIAAMGIAPAITGVMSGIPYKIFSNISAQPHKIMTTSTSIKSLSDITDEQIALVNIGSIQHILLAMASEKELGDAHALDDNIVAMSHPDGMTSMLSGSVSIQLTTSPYIFQEEASQEADVSVLYDLAQVWPEGNSFIVGLASNDLHDNDPELYNAVCEAAKKAMEYINSNKDATAQLLADAQSCEKADMLNWLSDPGCVYSAQLQGVMDMANFMVKAGFIQNGPSQLSDIVYSDIAAASQS